jgi:hypothetical protein
MAKGTGRSGEKRGGRWRKSDEGGVMHGKVIKDVGREV